MRRECRERFPRQRGLAIPTCITARIPGACATHNFTYPVRGPLHIPNVVIIVLNTLRPRQNGRQFTDDIIKYIFLNENVWVSIKISVEFIPKGPVNVNNIPLSEPMGASSLMHICVARPRWVKAWKPNSGVSLLHSVAKYGLLTCVHHFYVLERYYNISDISAIHVWHSNKLWYSFVVAISTFIFRLFSNTHFPSFSENKCL